MGLDLERAFLVVVSAWLVFRLRWERLEYICVPTNCPADGRDLVLHV